ncbi:MAG: HAD family hydrolase [Syntrophomonas sp.]|nr:HAD family hydrolase [Syntrophomonas sp.]
MKLAVFDFDGTLLMKDTLPCLLKEWLRQKRSRIRCIKITLSVLPPVLLYKGGILPRENMKSMAFNRFNRLYTSMTRQEIEDFFLAAYPYLFKEFNPLVLEEIKLAQEQGFYCLLLSGAYSQLLQIVGAELGIDKVIGARLAYKDNVFDNKGDTPFIDGRSKLLLLQQAFADEEVDWEASIAFGDSYADICIMEKVGQRVAVNPDPQLLHHAHANSWRVISFPAQP